MPPTPATYTIKVIRVQPIRLKPTDKPEEYELAEMKRATITGTVVGPAGEARIQILVRYDANMDSISVEGQAGVEVFDVASDLDDAIVKMTGELSPGFYLNGPTEKGTIDLRLKNAAEFVALVKRLRENGGFSQRRR